MAVPTSTHPYGHCNFLQLVDNRMIFYNSELRTPKIMKSKSNPSRIHKASMVSFPPCSFCQKDHLRTALLIWGITPRAQWSKWESIEVILNSCRWWSWNWLGRINRCVPTTFIAWVIFHHIIIYVVWNERVSFFKANQPVNLDKHVILFHPWYSCCWCIPFRQIETRNKLATAFRCAGCMNTFVLKHHKHNKIKTTTSFLLFCHDVPWCLPYLVVSPTLRCISKRSHGANFGLRQPSTQLRHCAWTRWVKGSWWKVPPKWSRSHGVMQERLAMGPGKISKVGRS